MARQLPILFGQLDYSQQLGTAPESTIALYGCYLVSFANLARACGKDTDPVELNKLFIEKGLYVKGNLIQDDNLTKVFPDIIYQNSINYTDTPADLALLKETLKDPSLWVIVKIQLQKEPWTHFALVTGVNGTVTIADPLTKKNEDFAQRYGDPATNILKFVVYRGTPARGDIDDAVRIERDINWNVVSEVISHLGIEVTPSDKPGMAQRAKEKIDGYISQIAGYKKQVEDLLEKNNINQKLILDLKDEISKVHKEDTDYGKEALDAQHKVNELREDMQKIGETLDLQYDPNNDKKLVEQVLMEINHLRSSENDDSNTKLLREILKTLIGMGMNNYLTKIGKGAINPDTAGDEVLPAVNSYLAKIVEEYLNLDRPQEPVLTDKPFKEQRSPLYSLIKLLLKPFIYV